MEREHFNALNLHPAGEAQFRALIHRMRSVIFRSEGKQFVLQPFEGFRHPERQNDLFADKKVTKARPWESAHQYGLAVDFAGRCVKQTGALGDWFWPIPENQCWIDLKRRAALEALDVPISWDHGHVQHPLFDRIKELW